MINRTPELALIVQMVRDAGYAPMVEQGSKHTKVRWRDADGYAHMFVTSKSPTGNWRTLHNVRARLRRELRPRSEKFG